MKLREYLEQMEPTELVKVGAKGGSSFIWCGEAGDLLGCIEEIDKALFQRTKAAASKNKKDFLKSMSVFSYAENPAERMKELEEKKAEEKADFTAWTEERIRSATEGIRSAYSEWLAAVANKQADAIAAEKLMREPVSIADREVVTTFDADAIVEPVLTHVVLINGWESGSYWSVDEVEDMKKKTKKAEGKA